MWKYLAVFCLSAFSKELISLNSDILIDARYYGTNNFVGTRVDGYDANKCFLSKEAANALKVAQKLAVKKKLSLKVFDCYRPQMAVDHLVRWARDLKDLKTKKDFYPNEDKATLFTKGYIAEKSGHSRGSTVDLTLVRYEHGVWKELDMGTPFDFFDPKSATKSLKSGKAHNNRLILKSIMEVAGFKNYSKEWWHYTLIDEPYPTTYFNYKVD